MVLEYTFQLKYECLFQTQFQLTFGGINTALTSINVDAGEATGTYDVAFTVFTDNTFQTPVTGTYSYEVPEPMHIAATLDTTEERLKVKLGRVAFYLHLDQTQTLLGNSFGQC